MIFCTSWSQNNQPSKSRQARTLASGIKRTKPHIAPTQNEFKKREDFNLTPLLSNWTQFKISNSDLHSIPH
jgi:hypothetical protein